MLLLMDLLSTHCFACTGALVAIRAAMRPWQILLAAMLTAIGGGTTRELLLASGQIFWMVNQLYLVAIVLAIPLAFCISTFFRHTVFCRPITRAVESIGTTVFIAVGVLAAIQAASTLPAIVLAGLFTGIGGGLIRQLILEQEFSLARNVVNMIAALITAIICTIGILRHADPMLSVLTLSAIHFVLVELFGRVQQRIRQGQVTKISGPVTFY